MTAVNFDQGHCSIEGVNCNVVRKVSQWYNYGAIDNSPNDECLTHNGILKQ